MPTFKTAAAMVLAGLSLAAGADEIENRIESATQAYQAGEYRQAIEALEGAIDELRVLDNRRYLALLPEPPAGWQADEGEVRTTALAQVGGGVHLLREYSRGEERVVVEMMANAPMLAALNVILNNPAMLEGNPNTEPYSFQGYKGIRKQIGEDGAEISLLVGKNTLVQIKGSSLQDRRVLQTFLEALDFQAIEQVIAS